MGALLTKLGTSLAFEGIRKLLFKEKNKLPELLKEYDGDEKDFINEMLGNCEWVVSDGKDILTTYMDKNGVAIGYHVRWPNRTYCYIATYA